MVRMALRLAGLACGALLAASCASDPSVGTVQRDLSKDPGYHVVGNRVLDKDGNVHTFHGVSISQLETSLGGLPGAETQFAVMANEWHANVLRVPLAQVFWLKDSPQYSKLYAASVLKTVEQAKAAGLDVILDLHRSASGTLNGTSDIQMMADEYSIQFWKEVAEAYKDDGRVLFELYNEPHNISWDIWLNGGTTSKGWTAVGMQQLYDTVRATGAKNLVIVGGLDWAYDLSGVATPGQPSYLVQGENIIYNSHPYDFLTAANAGPWKQPDTWDQSFGYLAATQPVILTEFGTFDCSTGYIEKLIDYCDQRGIGWIGWAWNTEGCGFPSLLRQGGVPSPTGAVEKAAMVRYHETQSLTDGAVPDVTYDLGTESDGGIEDAAATD